MDSDNNNQLPDGTFVPKPGADSNGPSLVPKPGTAPNAPIFVPKPGHDPNATNGPYSYVASQWSQPVDLNMGSTSASPALVYFKGKLHLFYTHTSGKVVWVTYDGRTWKSVWTIPGITTSRGVAAVSVNDSRLIVMASDSTNNQIVINWTNDGQHWQGFAPPLGQNLQSTPALVSQGNKVVALFKSGDTTTLKMMECADAVHQLNSWTDPVYISTSATNSNRSPAASIYTDRLFMIFTGMAMQNARFTQAIYNFTSSSWEYISEDAFNPIHQSLQTNTAAGLATLNGQLIMTYGNISGNNLWYAASIDGQWSINSPMPFYAVTYAAPAMATYGGKLFCVYVDRSNGGLFYTVLDPTA